MESLRQIIKTYPGNEGVKLLHLDQDLALGARNDVYIIMWRDRTTVEGATTLAQSINEYIQHRTKDLALITIIEPRAKMPSPGSREVLAAALNDASRGVLISGVAFEGDGFLAAGIRSVVVGLTLLAHQEFPHRVFKSVASATEWIESEHLRLGRHFKAKDLQSIAAVFRSLVSLESTRLTHQSLQYG